MLHSRNPLSNNSLQEKRRGGGPGATRSDTSMPVNPEC